MEETVEWLERLSAAQVSPAAGSAAAIAAGLGVALLIKLARRTRPRDVSGYHRLLSQLVTARDRLLALAEADASAIDAWLATRQLEEGGPEREAALRAMVAVPLEAAELCRTIQCEAQQLLACGHPPARPDGEVGARLLQASQRSLRHLAQANVSLLRDPSLIKTVQKRLAEL
jgi:formiminotetrahydrofolate cyclodeaminase